MAMAELVTESSLTRHVRVSGCSHWSSHNICLLATAEGMVVIRFTLPPQKTLNVAMCCDSIDLCTDIVEPETLDRPALIAQINNSHVKVQRMKLDKVVSPSLRSMGDELAIKQACWEPPGPTVYPRLAILAQKLTLYTYIDSQWELSLDISLSISEYLRHEPISNETDDPDELFSVHCSHVRLFTWTQAFGRSSGQMYCHVIVCNSYGHLLVVQLDYHRSSAPVVQLLRLPDLSTAGTKSMTWMSSNSKAGYLIIGRMDGTCALVGISSQLVVTSCRELELKADYRAVELSSQAQTDEMMFIKHRQVYIYNIKSGVMQSFDISETKYSLNQATATDSHVYVATGDAGIVIKSRSTGETVHIVSEKVRHTTHGVSLSPSGVFMFTVSEPIFPDTYVYLRPVVLRLYKLKPLEDYLTELWNAEVILWDSFLMIGLHMTSLPQWIVEMVDDINCWPSMTVTQLRVLYVIYHCMVDKRHHTGANLPPSRLIQYDKLKQVLSIRHMKQMTPTDEATQDYIAGCEKLPLSAPFDGDLSHLPYKQCQMCREELRLSASRNYQCKNGHVAAMCSNTMLPMLCAAISRCTQCSAAVAGVEDVPVNLRCLMSIRCAYCSGSLHSDNLL